MSKPLFTTIHPLAGPFAATGNGVAVSVVSYDLPVGVLVSGTFVGTVVIEVSNDNVNWAQWINTTTGTAASFTAPGVAKIDLPVKFVRARCSAYTSGAIRVDLGATNSGHTDE